MCQKKKKIKIWKLLVVIINHETFPCAQEQIWNNSDVLWALWVEHRTLPDPCYISPLQKLMFQNAAVLTQVCVCVCVCGGMRWKKTLWTSKCGRVLTVFGTKIIVICIWDWKHCDMYVCVPTAMYMHLFECGIFDNWQYLGGIHVMVNWILG